MLRLGAVLVGCAWAQQPGVHTEEYHPKMPLWTCGSYGCSKEDKTITLDANWRWLHNGQYTNCYKDGGFDETLCPDPLTCAENCHLEGNSEKEYKSTYGIKETNKGIKMNFVTTTKYGSNFGSRVYMMDGPEQYKMFKLKNREFTLTVDMYYMPCGLNGAVYFVEMDADGGKAAATAKGGVNAAGAKYGTGYCDAQCPHDMKFMEGKANVIGWNASHDPPIGKYGACCAENGHLGSKFQSNSLHATPLLYHGHLHLWRHWLWWQCQGWTIRRCLWQRRLWLQLLAIGWQDFLWSWRELHREFERKIDGCHSIHHWRQHRWWRSCWHSPLLCPKWKGHPQLQFIDCWNNWQFYHRTKSVQTWRESLGTSMTSTSREG